MSDRNAVEPVRRIHLTEEQKGLVEEIRDQIKESTDYPGEVADYTLGVIDALAFVWAGMPKEAGLLYRSTMSQFADVMREAGL